MAQKVWKILGWDGFDWYVLTYASDKKAAFDYYVEGGWDKKRLKAIEVTKEEGKEMMKKYGANPLGYGVFAYDEFDEHLEGLDAYFSNKKEALSYASSIKNDAPRVEAWESDEEGSWGVSGEPLVVYEFGLKIEY